MADHTTTALDPARARQMIAEAREDDARMTPSGTAWRRDVGVYGDPEGDEDLAFARGPMVKRKAGEPPDGRWLKQAQADSDGIARTRNNLAALADQLEAALAEIDRLRAPIGSTGLLERANKMRDRLRELGVDVDGPGYSLDPPFGRLPERVTVDTFKSRNRHR